MKSSQFFFTGAKLIFSFVLIAVINSCGTPIAETKNKANKFNDSVAVQKIYDSLGTKDIEMSIGVLYSTTIGTQRTLELTLVDPKALSLDDDRQLQKATRFVLDQIYSDPATFDTTLTSIKIAFKKGMFVKSVSGELRDLIYTMARNADANNDTERMEKWCQMGLSKYPSGVEFHELRAGSAMGRNDLWSASEEYRKLNELHPDNELYQCSYAYCFFKMGKKEKALSLVEKCMERNATYDYAYVVRGLIYDEEKDFEKAEKDFLFAVSMDSVNATNLLPVSKFYLGNKKYTNALKYIDKLISADPGISESYFVRGKILLEMKKDIEACREFKTAKSLGFDVPDEFIQKCQ
jgi:tetratricopeptide (TPR) repeat protein